MFRSRIYSFALRAISSGAKRRRLEKAKENVMATCWIAWILRSAAFRMALPQYQEASAPGSEML
jgi:hypothetical protein